MRSMTGFSESNLLKDDIEFKCISKSLNSRFLEINIKLPVSLKSHEGWVREYIQKNFTRGKKILSLINDINFNKNFTKKTLSGCIFEKVNKSIIISKEI